MEEKFCVRKKPFYVRFRQEIVCYSILAIPIILFSIFFVFGFVRGFIYSLLDYDLRYIAIDGVSFIGFRNYIKAFTDIRFTQGILHTSVWTFVMLIGNNLFGLLMALCIMKLRRGKGFFVTCMYWPALVSAAVGTQITLYMFNPTNTGILNSILASFNIPPKNWLGDKETALISLMAIPFFTGFSMKMMIYYAGLRSIPKIYYEAAKLETNNGFAVFWRITWPLLAPIVFLNLLMSVIDGIKVIAPMQLITPDNEFTMSAVYALYLEAFSNTNFSYAFAMGFILFVIIMALTLIQNRLKKEEVVYE